MIPLKDTIPTQRFPYVTVLLILINWVVFLFEVFGDQATTDQFITQYALIPGHLALLNFVSYQFLHGGWLHVAGNMFYLWVFGNNIEDRLGSFPFLLFYLSAGIVGGLTQVLLTHTPIPIIGASAAVAGILGTYLVWYPRSQVKVLLPIIFIWTVVTLPASFVLILWFLTNVLSGYSSLFSAQLGGVAYLGHIGGFLFGVLIAYLVGKPKNPVYTRSANWL